MEGETVIAGVDTHKDVHVLCLLDGLGRKIWSGSFRADPEGYDRLAEAIGDPGGCLVVGVEGTASYGAGLTRRLVELGYNVVEVLRPKRDKARPGEGKSDPLDAERAARKAASGRGCSVPKSQDGWVEAVRQLYVARRLAVATSTSCVACAKSMLTTAPGALRERFRGRERPKDLMPLLARGRKAGDALEESVLASLRSVAAVWKEARSQVESCDERIRALLEANAPALLGVEGCGTTTAAALVVAAGDNPGRLKGEAAFSMLCGVSPIPASSGKTERHRLNRGGNRQANWALYEIAIKRMAYDERTKRYVARRTSEGKSGLATLMWTVPGGAQETGGPYMRDPRHPRHFTDEFKRQIVDLYNAGKPKREIMDEYDLGKSTVERWIKSINATGSPRAACNRTPEQNRILELERENRRLRMEVDVLKQAALIYARK